ncbi:LMO1, partial [Candida theae]
MSDSSRTINHKLNEILSKNNINKSHLDESTALNYATVLKSNILGKDKQEKVNSIVVLAKLLDCIIGSDAVSDEFVNVLDHQLFRSLFSIISVNMSSETYKAILKVAAVHISGAIFRSKDTSIVMFLPLYETLIEYLDVIDIMTTKLLLQDNKIILNSIKLVTDLINRALRYNYAGIITLSGRLKHVMFFCTIDSLVELTEDKLTLEAIEKLKVAYYNLNVHLSKIHFDLSIPAHQIMLNNLFIFLEVSLNEYGSPATTSEYVKAGFTENPREFIVQNFSILLAMDLKIFLKDPNFTFKKRFHEELMMSEHSRTFPLSLFIAKTSKMWIDIFEQRQKYPNIVNSILNWELMIYYTMNNCLILWQETKSQNNQVDIDKILQLLESYIDSFEEQLGGTKTIEECLDITSTRSGDDMRHNQALKISKEFTDKWNPRLVEFNQQLSKEVAQLVSEQRVVQLLKGSWVFTESFGEALFSSRKNPLSSKYYYIVLSPNRKWIYFKDYSEKPSTKPSIEELEQSGGIRLSDVHDLKSIKIGESIGEKEKQNNSMLISIKGTISYEKITILGANKTKLLSFYTDSEVNRFVWLDGLKMLKGIKSLSEETQKQIASLIEIRRNTQSLSLEGAAVESDDDDEEFYDYDELSALAAIIKAMQLSDLPAELVLQALPVRECLLNWPSDIVIMCLDLLSQVESFELMAEVAYGSNAYKDARRGDSEVPWAEVRCNVAIFARRFANKIYITIGNRLPSRLYKKYIIFDLEVVKDLAAQYYFLTAVLQIWTGDEYSHQYVMLPYFSFKDPYPYSTLRVISTPDPEPMLNCGLFNIVTVNAFQVLRDSSIWMWSDKLWSIHTVEVCMSVEKYKEIFDFTTKTRNLSLVGKPAPIDLRVYITGQTMSSGLSTVSAFYIFAAFKLVRVRNFSLQCSVNNAELTYLDFVLNQMPSLTYLNVSFGNLDFAWIPRVIGWRECCVQVTIDRAFYESRQDQCDRKLWDTYVFDNVVIL